MKPATETVIALLLMIAMCVPMVVPGIVTIVVKQSGRARAKGLALEHNKALTNTISIAVADVHWIESGKEFLYHSAMYDVVSMDVVGDTATIIAVRDDNEEALHEAISALQQQELPFELQRGKRKHVLQKLLSLKAIVALRTKLPLPLQRTAPPTFCGRVHCSSPYQSLLFDPPETKQRPLL
jgi:hypothetical protein